MNTVLLALSAAGFAAGSGLLQQQAVLPALDGAFLILPCAMVCGYAYTRASPRLRKLLGVAAVGIAVASGFFWAAWVAQWRMSDRLDAQWEDRELTLVGVIASIAEPGERGSRFQFDVEQIAPADARAPHRVLLNWYASGPHDGDAIPSLQPGQRWRLVARLRRPHGNANPHGFDYEAYLFEQGLRATGSVRTETAPQLLAEQVPGWGYAIERLRAELRARVLHALPGAPYAGVIAALVMGDQRAIEAAHWQVFTRTGINHLMSISGLHITMLAAAAYFLVRMLWRAWPRLALHLAAQRAAMVAGLLTAWFYTLLSGFAVPSQRTVVMLAAVALGLFLSVNTSALALLSIALIAVLLLDPMAVLSVGFWLSFASVAILMFSASGRIQRVPWYEEWARAQWAVTIALTPILIVLFQQASLVSPVANMIAVPVVSFVVVPVALLGSVLNVGALLDFAHTLMSWLMLALQWLANLPSAVWAQHAPPAWTLLPALIGVMWIMLPRGFPSRWVGGLLLAPMFLVMPTAPDAGVAWVEVLDVGQGLAVVVRTHEHALLFDAGPRYTSTSGAGDYVVVPYLRGEGVQRLDRLLVSHDDSDHTGGVAAVLRAVPVTQIFTSVPIEKYAPHAVARCEAGEHWEWDQVRFEIVHPDAASYAAKTLKNNDRSCVLRVVSRFGSALITGDIEKRSEVELLERAADLRADVLVVPHHGSGTSSSTAFIAKVGAKFAVFAAGYHNRFGHPKFEVVERYRQTGARILRSDYDGWVTLKFTPRGIQLETWRERTRHYWSDR